MSRRIPLEEVVARTKIPQRSLEMLERDDFASLPADVFVRGFIRGYAGAVGLDPARAIAVYDRNRVVPIDPHVTPAPAAPIPIEAPGQSRRRVGMALVMLIVIILATLTISILFSDRAPPTASGPPWIRRPPRPPSCRKAARSRS